MRGQAHLEGEPPVGRVLVEDHGDRPAAVADLGRAGDVRERLVRGRVEVDGLLRQRTRVAARRLVHVPRRVEAGRVERAGPGGPGEQEVRRVDGLPVGPADALGDGVLDRERVARDDLRGPVARVGGDGAVRGDLGEPRVRRVHDLPVAVGATVRDAALYEVKEVGTAARISVSATIPVVGEQAARPTTSASATAADAPRTARLIPRGRRARTAPGPRVSLSIAVDPKRAPRRGPPPARPREGVRRTAGRVVQERIRPRAAAGRAAPRGARGAPSAGRDPAAAPRR